MYLLLHVMLLFKYFEKFNRDGLIGKIIHFFIVIRILNNREPFQGITYDHIELNFYLNGEPINAPVIGIKGRVYPILYGKFPVLKNK